MNRQPIELFKILKFEGLVNSGGQAKMLIADGQVKLNGKIETQKSKKILSGDVIEFEDHVLQMLLKTQEVASEVASEAASEVASEQMPTPSEPASEV